MSDNYKIFETEQFIKSFNKIKGKSQAKIYVKILNYIYSQLKNNPYYGKNIKKLRNWSSETLRNRSGDFRIFYEINENEKIVFITSFEKRKDAY